MTKADKHSLRSSEREEYVEYAFLAQLCSYDWSVDRFVEVSRAQTDAHGYDLVLSCEGVTRHVQLKASKAEGSTRAQKINLALTKKPSGCIVWMKVNPDTLEPQVFGWFGNSAGQGLLDLGDRVAKHTKANSLGNKSERPNLREVAWSRFTKFNQIEELFSQLFDTPDNEVT